MMLYSCTHMATVGVKWLKVALLYCCQWPDATAAPAAKARFVRGVGTASDASLVRTGATQIGVACQVLRPASATHVAAPYSAGPPTMSMFPTEL